MKKTQALIAAIVAAGLITTGIVRAEDRSSGSASGAQSSTQSSSGQKLSHTDKKFLEEAAQGGMAEVAMGRLGQEKAQSPEVKRLAEKILQDHTQANQQLMQIAQQKGVELKQDVNKKDQRMLDHMRSMSGAEFDRMYVQHMVKDHEKDIKEFEKQANKGEDADIKNFAQQTLPKLREHLQSAQTLAQTTGASANEPAGAEKKSHDKQEQK
jgi:putative membrane protein